MTTHENGPPPEWWKPDPRPDPFAKVAPTACEAADEHLILGEN